MIRAKFLRVNVNELRPTRSVIAGWRDSEFGDLPKYIESVESGNLPVNEGQVIYKAVGKIVKKPPTKKAKPFEVGKTYKNATGRERTIVAIGPDGVLCAVETADAAYTSSALLYNPDGTHKGSMGVYEMYRLIPEYEEIPGGFTIEEIKE